MARRQFNEAVACVACGRPTTNPRRGKCDRCYMAEHLGKQPAEACACCGQADRRVLVRRHMAEAEGMVTLCANCGAVMGRRLMSLSQLAAEVRPPGDRRQTDRRAGRDQRRGDRRQGIEPSWLLDEHNRRQGGRRATDKAEAAA